jgi:hypothetical protein
MPSSDDAGRPSMELVVPALVHLPSYVDALNRDWSPDNIRGRAAALDELAEIASDREAFLARLVDREARGAPVRGVLVEAFRRPSHYGGTEGLRFRIDLRARHDEPPMLKTSS